MLKSIVICTFLCGLAMSKEISVEWPNVQLKESLVSRNLFTVKMRDHLYSLTWKNETHVKVYSTNQTEKHQNEKCTFNAMEYPFAQIDSGTVLNTAVLGDNQTIAVVGYRYPLTAHFDPNNTYAYYDIFLLDLINCTFKDVVTAHLSVIPVWFEEHPPQVIAYHNTFEVFFNNEKPQRYNITGYKIPMEHQQEVDFKDEEYNSFYIRLLDPKNAKQTYFYVYNYHGDTAVMKILDKNFAHTQQKTVDHQIDLISVNKDIGAPIGICYFPKNKSRTMMHCERLDAQLLRVKKQFNVTVPQNHFIFNATLTLDNMGNAFVGVLYGPLHSTKRQLAVFIYNHHGDLSKSFDLRGDFDIHSYRDYYVQLDSYIVEGLGGEYCIVAYEVKEESVDHHKTHIQCFEVPKELKTMQ